MTFTATSRMTPVRRAIVLAAALALGLACLADVVHALARDPGGCATAKLESQRAPVSLADAAVDTTAVEPSFPSLLVTVVCVDPSPRGAVASAAPTGPRAPPRG